MTTKYCCDECSYWDEEIERQRLGPTNFSLASAPLRGGAAHPQGKRQVTTTWFGKFLRALKSGSQRESIYR